MTGVFACPECGLELPIAGLSPGREVQCASCSTWVEVPFLPRAGPPKRDRGRGRASRSPWASKTLIGAVAFAGLALLGLVASRMIGGRVQSDRERVLTELVASADGAEAAKRYDAALREAEAALAQARTFEREGSGRLAELIERRDRVSRLEAKSRLGALDGLDPDRAVGEALTLRERSRRDRALEPLDVEIEGRLAKARARRVEAELSAARRALEEGRDADAVASAIRLHDHAGDLAEAESRPFRDEAEAVLRAAVGRSGVALPPVDGRFAVGSASAYDSALDPFRLEAFRSRGYLPQPRRSPWSALWDEVAPFALALEVAEAQDEIYLQSKNRSTVIDATVSLRRGEATLWKSRIVARTRAPLPDLPAYLAGRLATAGRRDPDIERRLHADAFAQFVEQAARGLRSLPNRQAAAKLP